MTSALDQIFFSKLYQLIGFDQDIWCCWTLTKFFYSLFILYWAFRVFYHSKSLLIPFFGIADSVITSWLPTFTCCLPVDVSHSLTSHIMYFIIPCLHSLLPIGWTFCSFWFPVVAAEAPGATRYRPGLHVLHSNASSGNQPVLTWRNSHTSHHPTAGVDSGKEKRMRLVSTSCTAQRERKLGRF